MSKIQEISKRLAAASIEDIALKAIRDNDTRYIALNQSQLLGGRDSNDKLLRPPYSSKYYAAMKRKMNPAGVVDLKLTGEFYGDWFVSASSFPVVFGSINEKTQMLADKYGDNLFGLNKKNRRESSQSIIRPRIATYLRGLMRI